MRCAWRERARLRRTGGDAPMGRVCRVGVCRRIGNDLEGPRSQGEHALARDLQFQAQGHSAPMVSRSVTNACGLTLRPRPTLPT